jgi:uncharacterized DUF497 family protein
MTVQIRGFQWDEHNLAHLDLAHPQIGLDDLEDIVREASAYAKTRRDRYGRMVYTAKRENLTVLFNLLPGNVVRIFSVREG